MFSRARMLLGFPGQLLRRGPPANWVQITATLEEKVALTLKALEKWPAYDALQWLSTAACNAAGFRVVTT